MLLVKVKIGTNILENWQYLLLLTVCRPHKPATPLLEINAWVHKKKHLRMFTAASLIKARNWSMKTKMPMNTREGKWCYIHTMEYYLAIKKKKSYCYIQHVAQNIDEGKRPDSYCTYCMITFKWKSRIAKMIYGNRSQKSGYQDGRMQH